MVNHKVVSEALRIAVTYALPVALRGRPGVGKTSMVLRLARELGMECEIVVGSLREPTDIGGLPVIDRDGSVKLAPPQWVTRANGATQGCLVLFDELTTASPAVQAAMLRVLRERVVGEVALAKHVRLVAAYNDATDCGGYELELPMRSRLVHLEVNPDVSEFAKGLVEGWANVTDSAGATNARSGNSRRYHWATLVAWFVDRRPSILLASPDEGSWGGYPTPRTWEMVVDVLSACELEAVCSDVRLALTVGCVGEGAALEFEAYISQLDLPSPDELLENPTLAKRFFDAKRPDRNLAILSEIVARVEELGTASAWEAAWDVGEKAVEQGFGDLCVWAFRRLPKLKPVDAVLPKSVKVLQPIMGLR